MRGVSMYRIECRIVVVCKWGLNSSVDFHSVLDAWVGLVTHDKLWKIHPSHRYYILSIVRN